MPENQVRDHFYFDDDVSTYNDTELDQCKRLLEHDMKSVLNGSLKGIHRSEITRMQMRVQSEMIIRGITQ